MADGAIDKRASARLIGRMSQSMRLAIMVLFAFVLAVAGAAPTVADHAAHSPAKAVVAALNAATVEGEDDAGKTYRIAYRPDGTARLEIGGRAHDGTWSVDKGGHYCETWPGLFDGKRRCTGIEIAGPLLIMRGPIATTRTVVRTPGR